MKLLCTLVTAHLYSLFQLEKGPHVGFVNHIHPETTNLSFGEYTIISISYTTYMKKYTHKRTQLDGLPEVQQSSAVYTLSIGSISNFY